MKDHFESILRPIFRKDADFRHVELHGDGLRFRIDWKMPDEGRPNKHSRPIELYLSEETLEDYEDAPHQQDREEMDRRIVDYVAQRLAAFNPDHNVPREQPVPAERWVISPEVASP